MYSLLRHRPVLLGSLRRYIAAFCLAALGGLFYVPGATADAAQAPLSPAEVVEAFHEALATGDRAGALSYLAADLVVFESGRAEMSLQEYTQQHLKADMEFSATTRRVKFDQQEHVKGRSAWVLNRTRSTGSFRGKQIGNETMETMILRRVDRPGKGRETAQPVPAAWKIVHIHWSTR